MLAECFATIRHKAPLELHNPADIIDGKDAILDESHISNSVQDDILSFDDSNQKATKKNDTAALGARKSSRSNNNTTDDKSKARNNQEAANGNGSSSSSGSTTIATSIESHSDSPFHSPLPLIDESLRIETAHTVGGSSSKLSHSITKIERNVFESRIEDDLSRILEPAIVDIAVIFPKDGESIPKGYKMINKTPYNTPADLSNGILTGGDVYLCVQFNSSIEGSNKIPIYDITLVHMENEECPDGYTLVKESISGKVANINKASTKRQVFVAYKRIPSNVDEDERYHSLCPLADLCVLNISKKQKPPLGFTLVDKSTTVGNWTGSVMKLAFRRTKPVGMLDSTFSCTVADRFPKIDKPGSFPLPPMISMFTAPYGLKFERRLPTDVPLPKFFTFVLTTEVGEKVHGACLSFYEELDEEDELQLEESYNEHINTLSRQLGELNPKNGPLYRLQEFKKMTERGKKQRLIYHGTADVANDDSRLSMQSPRREKKTGNDKGLLATKFSSRRHGFFHKPRGSTSSIDSTKLSSATASIEPLEGSLQSMSSVITEVTKYKIYAPTSICILSLWPFYGNFKRFLNVLYQISLSPSNIPVENVIGSFISKIPKPIPGGPLISITFGQGSLAVSPIIFSLPKELGLPLCEADFEIVFRHLSPDHFVQVFTLMLLERKILIHSKHRSLLNQVAECLRALMFPLDWRNVYVPVCPEGLMVVIEAPMAFLVGSDTEWVENNPVPEGIWVVSVDEDKVYCSSRLESVAAETGAKPLFVTGVQNNSGESGKNSSSSSSSLSSSFQQSSNILSATAQGFFEDDGSYNDVREGITELPQALRVELINRILDAVNKYRIRDKEIHQVNEDPDVAYIMAVRADDDMNESNSISHSFADLVRDAGLRTMISLIGSYRKYLLLPTVKIGDEDKAQFSGLFDVQGFLTSAPKTHRPFLEEMMKSQSFSSFIEECANAYEKNHAQKLLFFDSAIQAHSMAHETKSLLKEAESVSLSSPSPSANSLSPQQSPPGTKASFKSLKQLFSRSISQSKDLNLVEYDRRRSLSSDTPISPGSAATPSPKDPVMTALNKVIKNLITLKTNNDNSKGYISINSSKEKDISPILVASVINSMGERNIQNEDSMLSFDSWLLTDFIDAISSIPGHLVDKVIEDVNNSNHPGSSSISKQSSMDSSVHMKTPSYAQKGDKKVEIISNKGNYKQQQDEFLSKSSRDRVININISNELGLHRLFEYPYDLSEFQYDGCHFRKRCLSCPLPAGPNEPISQMMKSVPIDNFVIVSTKERRGHRRFPTLDVELLKPFIRIGNVSGGLDQAETFKMNMQSPREKKQHLQLGKLFGDSPKPSWIASEIYNEAVANRYQQKVDIPSPSASEIVSDTLPRSKSFSVNRYNQLNQHRLEQKKSTGSTLLSESNNIDETPSTIGHSVLKDTDFEGDQEATLEEGEMSIENNETTNDNKTIFPDISDAMLTDAQSTTSDITDEPNKLFMQQHSALSFDGIVPFAASSTDLHMLNLISNIGTTGRGSFDLELSSNQEEKRKRAMLFLTSAVQATASYDLDPSKDEVFQRGVFSRIRTFQRRRLSFGKIIMGPTRRFTSNNMNQSDILGGRQLIEPEIDDNRARNNENQNKVAWAATRTDDEIVAEGYSLKIAYSSRHTDPVKWIRENMLHLLGIWFLCLPSYIAASTSPQSVLLQALTIFRKNRKKNIEIDEAVYRSLIISCGNCGPLYANDAERLLKDFTTKRKQSPNAITFIQYTRSVTRALIDTHKIFQLTSTSSPIDSSTIPRSRVNILRKLLKAKTVVSVFIALLRLRKTALCLRTKQMYEKSISPRESLLNADGSIASDDIFEETPKTRLKGRGSMLSEHTDEEDDGTEQEEPSPDILLIHKDIKLLANNMDEEKRQNLAMCPCEGDASVDGKDFPFPDCITVLCSKNTCSSCGNEILDEEVMASWSADLVVMSPSYIFYKDQRKFIMECPICNEDVHIKLRYQVVGKKFGIHSSISGDGPLYGECNYLDLCTLRSQIEGILHLHGSSYLYRDTLRKQFPDVYWNILWYINLAELPFPLFESFNEEMGTRPQTPSSRIESPAPDFINSNKKKMREMILVGWDGNSLIQKAKEILSSMKNDFDISSPTSRNLFPQSRFHRSQYNINIPKCEFENIKPHAFDKMGSLVGNISLMEDIQKVEERRVNKHLIAGTSHILEKSIDKFIKVGETTHPNDVLGMLLSLVLQKRIEESLLIFLKLRIASGDGRISGWEVFSGSAYRELKALSQIRISSLDEIASTEFDTLFRNAIDSIKKNEKVIGEALCPADYLPKSLALSFRSFMYG